MSLYNAAAWLARREQHLALNAVLYTALTAWERRQVERHLCAIQRALTAPTVVGQDTPPAVVGTEMPPAASDLVAA